MSEPDFYRPRTLRDVEPESRELAYGIGYDHGDGTFGMTHGPCALEVLLEIVGEYRSVLVRFNADGSDDVVYRWDDVARGWRAMRRPPRERVT